MKDPTLKSAIDQAKLTSSREGIEQLDHEFFEDKHDREVQSQIDKLGKISEELRASNDLSNKAAQSSEISTKESKKISVYALVAAIASATGAVVSAIFSALSFFLK